MANQWFRLYGEFAHDPKVQMLNEVDQRRLIMLFCIRCNGTVPLQDEEIVFQLRISEEEWQKSKKTFIEKGFINKHNEVLNWDKRQYISDSSAERVAKHRAKKKQSSSVTVTPPEQNRTDTEQNITEQIIEEDWEQDFELFYKEYPKKVAPQKAKQAWKKTRPNIEVVLQALNWQKQSKQWFEKGGQFIPNPATWLNGHRWMDQPPEQVTF